MTYVLVSIIGMWNLIYAFSKKNKKKVAFLLMVIVWILFWGSYNNPDYGNYIRHYRSLQLGANIFVRSGAEFGYRILMKMAISIGLSYEHFLAIITLFGYLLIHSTVKKYSNDYNFVYLLYFIYPFFFDVVQVRNFLIMAIFIYAIQYLIDNSAKNKFKYSILIMLAGTIHYSAILYMPFILINSKKKNRLVYFIACFAIISSLLIILNDKQIPFIKEITSFFINKDAVIDWFDSRTNWGFILFWFLQIVSFFMMYITRKFYIRNKNIVNTRPYKSDDDNAIKVTDNSLTYINVIFWINTVAFIYFPLYLLASTFTRLMRNIVLLNYIAFSITNRSIIKRDERILYNILVTVYVMIFFSLQLMPYRVTIIEAVLKYNVLFR